ncbi:MAG TPA: prepilin-type N-terminal cleavage/methylation domain-containing protein [Candidatus Aquilonibacter sp.]|nr:prepilin-type N-terminal cleavage/methylation domain-containing protein [Candidatus Aquilonibacter sp.]
MKRAKGFSLIELMVALAILLIVVAATLGTLRDAMHTSEAITKMADVQDNLRSGLNLMARDIVQAGSGIPIGGILIPYSGAGSPAINRPGPAGLAFPVQSTLTAITPGYTNGPVSLGNATDVITVIYADNTLPWGSMAPINNPANPACAGLIAGDGSTITVDTTDAGCTLSTAITGNVKLQPGDLVMLTSAQGGNIIQQVTNVIGNVVYFSSGDAFGFNGAVATSGTIQQLKVGGVYPPISMTRIWMITYFLNTANPQVPMLVRQVNFNAPQEVGQVMENLQISYDLINWTVAPGIDERQIVAPDSPSQIRKVNIYLAARSEYPYSVTNQYFRTNLVTQISMRSLAFQNRYN